MRSMILGTGHHVPPKVVTNFDLQKIFDTSDEWVRQRSGIEERHYAEGECGPSDLAYEASLCALEAARLKPGDIDCIIFATLSPDYYFPGSGVLLGRRLGLPGVPAFDVRNQCCGFLFSLQVADSFIRAGTYRRVLIGCAERHSAGIDFSDRGRHVTVLFGDGAGAAVLGPSPDERHGVLSIHCHSDGTYAEKLMIECPSARHAAHCTEAMVREGRVYPTMDGKFVFKHAVTRMPEVMQEALVANGLAAGDVDHFLFHQANLRINEAVAQATGLPAEKCHNNIQRYGNMSAASIPALLDEVVRAGTVKDDQVLLMTAFGSGFTWASALVRWKGH